MIVADKPAASWIDEDVTGFETKLADLVRRFKNLEAVQKEVAAKGETFEGRRITRTAPKAPKFIYGDVGRWRST